MKKLMYLIVAIIALGLIVVGCFSVVPPAEQGVVGDKAKCTTIQDGELNYFEGYLEGEPYIVGYDSYGYNYQAHMFKGYYANASLGKEGFPPYEGDAEAYLLENPTVNENAVYWKNRDVQLIMKWSDTWLSNKDCNGDGKLDRGYACDPIIANSSACEGAWETNHQSGSYTEDNGKTCKWTYFVKIVKVPEDAVKTDGFWYTADGIEIGSVIWGAYARIQQVYNDQCTGEHGIEYLSPASPGFGVYK